MQEREAMALLVGVRGIGYMRRREALLRAGSARALMQEPERFAKALGEAGVRAVARRMEHAEQELHALREAGVKLVAISDVGYPAILRSIARPPHVLFVWGEADLRAQTAVAVVGTRDASEYGLRHARSIAGELARRGACVVSGLAVGIDAAAHAGTLDAGGRTIAVLGGALDRLFPEANRGLMERIIAQGGSVVSEYAMGRHPDRSSFLERNRIIAGLSQGVLVVEGPHRSGALSTATLALEEGRELFAVPGDVDRRNAQLPNALIAEGARPVATGADVLAWLAAAADEPHARKAGHMPGRERRAAPPRGEKPAPSPRAAAAPPAGMPAPPPQPTPADPSAPSQNEPHPGGDAGRAVMDALAGGELDFDALCARTRLGADELGALLVMLELEGRVVSLPGLRYRAS